MLRANITSDREKFTALCGYLDVSLRQLCARAGVRYATLHRQLQEGRALRFQDIDAICAEWDVPHSFFSNKDHSGSLSAQFDLPDLQHRPSVEAMISAYKRGARRVEAFRRWTDFYDLFHPPSLCGRPTVHSVGRRSLAALTVGSSDAALLQRAIDSAQSPAFHRDMLEAYSAAEANGIHCTPIMTMDLVSGAQGKRITATYSRWLLSVSDAEKSRFIINYSRLVRT